MAAKSACLNCEINKPDAKVARCTVIADNGEKKLYSFCQRCEKERRDDGNVHHVACAVCNKIRRLVMRQACRQTVRCINCVTGDNLVGCVGDAVPAGKAAPVVAAPVSVVPNFAAPPKVVAPVKVAPPVAPAAPIAPKQAPPAPTPKAAPAPAPIPQQKPPAPVPAAPVPVMEPPKAAAKPAVEVPKAVAKPIVEPPKAVAKPAVEPLKAVAKPIETPKAVPQPVPQPAAVPAVRPFQVAAQAAAAAALEAAKVDHLQQPESTMRLFNADELVVGREFGKGSFKSAYKCDWNGTPVVKVKFHMLNQEDKDAQRNFRDELAVVARLAHPNIVQFLGRCKNELAFVVSFCPNGSLFDVLFDSKNPARVAAKKQLTEVVRFKIALGVARAINFLHHCSPPMIHRDLKGSNVLLTENFDAMVTDFGLTMMKQNARGISQHKGEGTCNYMAPELFIVNGPNITEATDMWSFGCVLIELFGSMIPWASAKDDNEIGRRVTGRDEAAIVPPEIERVPQVAMKALIRRCLRRTPTDRCTSAQALAEIEKQAMSLGR